MLDYNSIADLIQAAKKENITISELVIRDQAEQTETPREKLFARMRDNLHVMQEAVAEGTAQDLKSTSGLTGGDAYKMQQYSKTGGLCGSFFGNALTRALAVSASARV
ncbi:MAG: L-serine ammonia-lyase, iron-sulfur-dependent, subunit alpha, partial [Butyricicoccus sp.]